MHSLLTISRPAPRVDDQTKHTKFINILSKMAVDIPNPYKTRIAAAVVYRGDIISVGVNQKKTHPFQAKYSKHPESVYLHAETAAIKNALKYLKEEGLKESILYVCRVKYYDHTKRRMVFGLAYPCPGCQKCIKTFGIGTIIYSLDGTGYERLRNC